MPSTKTSKTSTPTSVNTSPVPVSGDLVPVGASTAPAAAPVGASTAPLGLEADVSQELADTVPSFGNVLRSIGLGVSASQTALDKGVIDTVNKLKNTKITIVTDVIQTLDDDGLPSASGTRLVTQEVSVLNFVTPTVHAWKHVAVSMDLELGALDREYGMQFTSKQTSRGAVSGGLFWGFLGWGTHWDNETNETRNARTRSESDWSRGTVRLDAMLTPRPVPRFPAAATVTRGPELYFSQGATADALSGDAVTGRSMVLTITCRKQNGAPNPNKQINIDAGSMLVNFATTDGFTGSTTNPDGQVRLTLTRSFPSPAYSRPARVRVHASLGDFKRSFTTTL